MNDWITEALQRERPPRPSGGFPTHRHRARARRRHRAAARRMARRTRRQTTKPTNTHRPTP